MWLSYFKNFLWPLLLSLRTRAFNQCLWTHFFCSEAAIEVALPGLKQPFCFCSVKFVSHYPIVSCGILHSWFLNIGSSQIVEENIQLGSYPEDLCNWNIDRAFLLNVSVWSVLQEIQQYMYYFLIESDSSDCQCFLVNPSSPCPLKVYPLHWAGGFQLIDALDTDKASGPDGISGSNFRFYHTYKS